MPPEPLPWDRKDFFRERKHSHSDRPSDALGPVSSRWRDSPSSSSSFHGSRNNSNGDFPRWGGFNSDFRRPPGHGKQGGWHPYPEDSSHGYPPARSVDRLSEDDGFWPSGARGDGRCAKSYRDNRVSFGQKNWKSHSWDNNNHHSTLANTPRRPHNLNNQQIVDDSPTCASVLHRGLMDASNQPPSKDQPDKLKDQPDKPKDLPDKPKDLPDKPKDLLDKPKDQPDKPKDLHDTSNDVNGSSTIQKVDGESLLGSIDWKPLKWSRSGSLTSRGSGFSHSSSSKSIGGESNEPKNELPSTSATASESPESPPTDTATCSIHASALEDTSSRKKPRLGWGEGLAKYEKKKVEDPEDNLNKNDNTSCAANVESARSHSYSLADKSPKVAGLSDCASPATPSSVGCSSSPGLEEKTSGKVTDRGVDAHNLRLSYAPGSYNHLKEYPFNVEKLQFESISTLTALLNELLQCVDRSNIDSGFVKSSALGKLLLWKGDLSKAVEVIESEIDMLETELKSLKSEVATCEPCLVSSSSLSMGYREKPHEDASTILRPPPLEFVSSGDIVEDIVPCTTIVAEAHVDAKDEDIESPGTATSKFSELSPVGKLVCPEGEKGNGSDDIGESSNIEVHAPDVEKTRIADNEGSKIIQSGSCMQGNGNPYHDGECNLCGTILSSNNEIAKRASEVFVKLLPRCDHHVDALALSCEESEERDLLIKKKFLSRRRFLKFKERVISLKYRALQYLWYEDLRSLSLGKSRVRLQKRSDLAFRTLNNGQQKYRSTVRSRFSSPAYGNLASVPTSEIAVFTRKLLSDTPVVKHYRDSLKMPALILDEREKQLSRFVSSNGLVEDPCAVEKERALINPWTAEEREIFIQKLATFGKDFRKIASFLDHKTTADCIEFYYKNHKSDCFEKTKKKPEFKKGKLFSTSTYMVTSGNRWSSRDMNAASLDILGAASAIAAHDEGIDSEKLLSGPFSGKRTRGFDGVLERSSSFDVENERDNAAADVLAGICGSLSSEAMSSCITSSVDPGKGCQELKCRRVGSSFRHPLTPEVTQSMDDDTCSDESCGEMDPVDWTDEEKSLFLQAFSSYGKDFATISRRIQTKSRDECKVFFSKARKSLGLDMIQLHTGNERAAGSDDANEGGSDTEDACVVETGSVVCSDKSGSKIDEDFVTSPSNTNHADSIADGRVELQSEMNILSDNCDPGQVDDKDTEVKTDILIRPVGNQVHDVSERTLDGDGLVSDSEEEKSVRVSDQERTSGCDDLECGEEFACGNQRSVVGAGVETVAGTGCHGIAAALIERKDAEVSNGPAESEMENGDAGNEDMHLATFDFKGPGCGRQEFSGPSESADDAHQKVLPHHSVEDGKYSHVLQGHPLNFPAQISPAASTVSRPEKHPMTTPNFYLRRCNRTASQNSVAQLHFPSKSEGHKTDLEHRVSEKQCKNGDVKLFGQILSKPASQEKPSSIQMQDDDDTVSPSSCGKLDMKSAHDIERNSSISNYDHNFPVRSYGFWDGRRIRTGFATLPDSALLMPKYSAPISDYIVSSARLERQALKTATSTNDCNLSALSVDCNNVTHSDYQAYRSQNDVRPFTLDMKQRQDMYPDDQRNGFEMGSSIQPQEKGKRMIKLMGPCSGVSDPVAALKLHYARTQQPSGQSGSVTGKEESWRGQGDVGR